MTRKWTPAKRAAASVRAKAYWTPERRAAASAARLAQIAAMPLDATCRKCGTQINSRYVFCRGCWKAVPAEDRAAINARFVAGYDLRDQPDPAYWSAIEEACR